MNKVSLFSGLLVLSGVLSGCFESEDSSPTSVVFAGSSITTEENYPHFETSRQYVNTIKLAGGINQFDHKRQLVQTDDQPVVRMNRDTYYSMAIIDVSKGATVSMPDITDGLYMSTMVVTEDHRIQKMVYGGGERELSTHTGDHVYFIVRLDSTLTEEQAKVIQDQMIISSNSDKPFNGIDFDQASFEKIEKQLKAKVPAIVKRDGAQALTGMFTDPMDSSNELYVQEKYEVGAALGWGGAQLVDNVYEVSGNYPADVCHQATFADPKNEAFLSVTVYNKSGFMFSDEAHRNSNSNLLPNSNGTYTLSFGCGDDALNNIVTANDSGVFSIAARHYMPSEEVRTGEIRVLPTMKAQ